MTGDDDLTLTDDELLELAGGPLSRRIEAQSSGQVALVTVPRQFDVLVLDECSDLVHEDLGGYGNRTDAETEQLDRHNVGLACLPEAEIHAHHRTPGPLAVAEA